MMYPVLADVRYRQLGWITGDRRVVVTSLLLNWTLGPAPMVALADAPAGLAHLRTGLIIVDCTL